MRQIAVLAGLLVVAGASAGSLPQAGSVVGTLRFSLHDSELFAAKGGTLFVIACRESSRGRITVLRRDSGGRIAKRSMGFSLAGYLRNVVAGPDGVYAGTAVIKRFTSARDQLLRIDPRTLTVQARAFFPGLVTLVAQGSRLWATIGNGDVVRLNPRTLAVEARRRVLRHWNWARKRRCTRLRSVSAASGCSHTTGLL